MKPIPTLMASVLVLTAIPPTQAFADEPSAQPPFTGSRQLSRGVTLRTFRTTAAGKPVRGELLDVDLRDQHVSVGLLHPSVVAAERRVSEMAAAQRALAGVNGDFFNITETHPGIQPTGSSDGPELADGRPLKAAVPDGQRFGPALPAGATTKDVLAVGTDRAARLATLSLAGTIDSGRLQVALRGLNQYALPVGGIGAFTSDWGGTSRRRATCGTDTLRSAPCSTDTAEAAVRRGVVAWVGGVDGSGPAPRGTTVLVGREQGADLLRRLRRGDRVQIGYSLVQNVRTPLRFAVGGFPLLRNGHPSAPLDATPAPRTAAGIGRHGHRLLLLVVDGRSSVSAGMGLPDLAALLRKLGADDALSLDGGGSTTLVAREPGQPVPTVRNVPSDGSERPVANGIGVFVRP